MKKILLLILGIALTLSGCGEEVKLITPTPHNTDTPTLLPPTITATATLTATSAPTFTPTPAWVTQGPGAVMIPILLYHHVAPSATNSRYYVAPGMFEEQLNLLRNWGYTSITTEMLVKAITEGTSLPPHPIIITFDDCNLDTYATAFPLMKKYGFTGVLYVVGIYMDADKYMNVDQIKEMAEAGWEVGSHSMSHPEVIKLTPEQQKYEIVYSRKFLQKKLDLPILTFAYPFGEQDQVIEDYAYSAGYIAAMGADGFTPDQGPGNLYNLQRSEIKGSEDAKTFTRFLPWQGDPIYLPTDTPAP